MTVCFEGNQTFLSHFLKGFGGIFWKYIIFRTRDSHYRADCSIASMCTCYDLPSMVLDTCIRCHLLQRIRCNEMHDGCHEDNGWPTLVVGVEDEVCRLVGASGKGPHTSTVFRATFPPSPMGGSGHVWNQSVCTVEKILRSWCVTSGFLVRAVSILWQIYWSRSSHNWHTMADFSVSGAILANWK
jgi:hypothetical protein